MMSTKYLKNRIHSIPANYCYYNQTCTDFIFRDAKVKIQTNFFNLDIKDKTHNDKQF